MEVNSQVNDHAASGIGITVVRLHVLTLTVVFLLAVAPAAWGYMETSTTPNPRITPSDCAICHRVSDVSISGSGEDRQGPHGGYSTTTSSCVACHMVHNAPAGYMLLPGATITETCELCHDGTGGGGVYGTIEARGLTVASAHRTESSAVVPGGNESTGGTSTVVFSGSGGTLSCGDCHSPHGVNVVESFTGDRRRIATDTAGFFSNRLLLKTPTSATTETPVYGSDWCAGCHKGRLSGQHDVTNHPVDTSATVGPGAFTYENVQVVDGVDSSQTVPGSLGNSNFGYVMPWPRTSGQGAHLPICQQCHEDGRNVGDLTLGRIAAQEVFTVTTSDGGSGGDNPRFQTFPHESQNPGLLIETGDDLCTNCHHPDQLP